MTTISQTTFSNAFSWMKMFEFAWNFHRCLFPRAQLTISQHWFSKWLGAIQATSHYFNQWWFVYWRIYASLGLNEFRDSAMLHLVKQMSLTLANFGATSATIIHMWADIAHAHRLGKRPPRWENALCHWSSEMFPMVSTMIIQRYVLRKYQQ